MAFAHNVTSLVLSILAWIFFIIGCIGNSTGDFNVENAPWIIVNPEGNGKHIFFGTQAFYQENNLIGAPEDLTKYSNCESTYTFCTPCKDNGRVTFAMLCIAVIFAAFAIIFSTVLIFAEVASVQYTNLAFTSAATIMACVGWSVFMHRCYNAIDDAANHLEYGAAGSITLLGFLLMGINVMVNVWSIACPCNGTSAGASSKGTPAAVPQSEPEEAKPVV